MKKIIVGIIPRLVSDDIDPYLNKNEFVDMYANKIYELNHIPIGVLLENNKLNLDVMDMCDCFILMGGYKADKHYYEAIEYAIINNKPILGICLGMQAMGIYSLIKDKSNNLKDINKVYQKLKEDNNGNILNKLDSPNGHGDIIVTKEKKSIDSARHNIDIKENTVLYDIYKKKNISVVSLHNYVLPNVGSTFSISATKDNVIEAIEYNDNKRFVLGVQFHPEIEEDNHLFKRLIDEAITRKI